MPCFALGNWTLARRQIAPPTTWTSEVNNATRVWTNGSSCITPKRFDIVFENNSSRAVFYSTVVLTQPASLSEIYIFFLKQKEVCSLRGRLLAKTICQPVVGERSVTRLTGRKVRLICQRVVKTYSDTFAEAFLQHLHPILLETSQKKEEKKKGRVNYSLAAWLVDWWTEWNWPLSTFAVTNFSSVSLSLSIR